MVEANEFTSRVDARTMRKHVKALRLCRYDNEVNKDSFFVNKWWYREIQLVPFLGWVFLFILKKGGIYMQEELTKLRDEALQKVREATDLKQLQNIRVQYLGKKDRLPKFFAEWESFRKKNGRK